MSDATTDILEHFGVKGMKWGVRRPRGKNGRVGSTQKTKFQKSPSRLSDAELAKRVKRLEMEKKYNELNETPKSEGKKMASRIVRTVGEETITKITKEVAYYAGKKTIEAAIGRKIKDKSKASTIAKDMFPKKK